MRTIDQEIIREEDLKNIFDSFNLETQFRDLPKSAVEVFSEEVLALLNSEETQLEPKMACSRFPNEFERKSKRENGRNKVHERRKLVDSKVIITGAPHYDRHQWRKYGQKAISNSNHPRTYYRCTHKEDQGCLARKQVQQQNKMSSCGDSPTFQVIYENEHSCTSTKTDDQYIFSFTNDTDYNNNQSNFILFDASKRSTYLNNDNILQDQHTCINHKMVELLNESNCRVKIEEDINGSGYLEEVIICKTIGNSKFRRCYYRCKFDGCKGKMKVQQINCNEFPEYEVTTTVGHTCNTTSRNQTLPPTNIEVPKSSGFQRRTFDNGVFSSRETLSSSIDFSCNDQDLNNLMAFIE